MPRHSHAARKHAHALLERAQRAVEIAIEEGESAALACVQDVPGRVDTAHQSTLPPTARAAHPTIYATEEVPLPQKGRESTIPNAEMVGGAR